MLLVNRRGSGGTRRPASSRAAWCASISFTVGVLLLLLRLAVVAVVAVVVVHGTSNFCSTRGTKTLTQNKLFSTDVGEPRTKLKKSITLRFASSLFCQQTNKQQQQQQQQQQK